ncbi:hypothetical protein LCGC14_3022580 [marine sediment metagenome]|uniref:Uncharacterized protein n=1 Tax=marine sediment metagenome TaxID=412755 RepID=A0A0F8ZKZ3_9ZZZZ
MITNELEQKASEYLSWIDLETREVINFITSQAKEKEARRVINAIADKEGWEESRDYYMKALAKPKE